MRLPSSRSHAPSRVTSVALCAALAAAACHHAPRDAVAPNVAQVVGDSTFGVRILKVDRGKAVATFAVGRPAYLALLAVRPGVSIEPIRVTQQPTMAGRYGWAATLPRAVTADPATKRPPVDEFALQRCVDAAMRAYAARTRTPVRRDSAGRVIQPPAGSTARAESEASVERLADENCRNQQMRTREQAPNTPWKDGASGYLLLLASATPLGDVAERLNRVSITADDARLTMAALGEALYAGKATVWGGSYAAW